MISIDKPICTWCAANLRNTATLIQAHYKTETETRWEPFTDRGDQAIIKFVQWWEALRALHPAADLVMNQLIIDGPGHPGGLYAVALVDGNTVCAAHLWDAQDRAYQRRRF